MATLIADAKKFINTLEVKYAAGVSEATWRKIAGMINFIGHRTHQEKNFQINGQYGALGSLLPIYAIDGLAFFEFDAEIFNVWVYNIRDGDSGTTELDLQVKPKASGAFESIFQTTPKITSAAPGYLWFEVGDSGTGITAPVFKDGASSFNVNAGDAIRLDLIQAMAAAEHCGIVIHYRPR